MSQSTSASTPFPKLEGDDLVARLGRHLTDAIVDGWLRPGERLNEVALAREFGVSRGPLREAARLLESRGLVVARARHGFYVRTFDAADLDDLYDLRLCIEGHAARLAAAAMTDEALASLDAHRVRMDELARDADPGLQVGADFALHRELCALAGNPRLLRVFDDLAVEIRLVIVFIGRLYADPVTIAATHGPILDALAARDPDAAASAIELHLGDARTRVVGQFRELAGVREDG